MRRRELRSDAAQAAAALRLDRAGAPHASPALGPRVAANGSLNCEWLIKEVVVYLTAASWISVVSPGAMWSEPLLEIGPRHGPAAPQGLRYLRGFVTEQEEQELLESVEAKGWLENLQRGQQFFGLVPHGLEMGPERLVEGA